MAIKTVVTYYFILSSHPEFNDRLMAALAPMIADGKTDGESHLEIDIADEHKIMLGGDTPIGFEVHREWNSLEAAEEWVATWTRIRDEYYLEFDEADALQLCTIEIRTT